MPRPVLGESCTTSIKDFAIFPPNQKKKKPRLRSIKIKPSPHVEKNRVIEEQQSTNEIFALGPCDYFIGWILLPCFSISLFSSIWTAPWNINYPFLSTHDRKRHVLPKRSSFHHALKKDSNVSLSIKAWQKRTDDHTSLGLESTRELIVTKLPEHLVTAVQMKISVSAEKSTLHWKQKTTDIPHSYFNQFFETKSGCSHNKHCLFRLCRKKGVFL